MNQDMQLLLAAMGSRLEASSNPLIQSLMAKEGLSPESAGSLSQEDAIAKLSQSNPALALLAQQMSQPRENREENSDFSEQDGEEQSRERALAVNQLRKKYKAMHAELNRLREINDTLAAALGACYICWGENPQCDVCSGLGHPGAFELDRRSFAVMVGPALKKIKKSSSAGRSSEESQGLKQNVAANHDTQEAKGGML